jgi:hypothetical protein
MPQTARGNCPGPWKAEHCAVYSAVHVHMIRILGASGWQPRGGGTRDAHYVMRKICKRMQSSAKSAVRNPYFCNDLAFRPIPVINSGPRGARTSQVLGTRPVRQLPLPHMNLGGPSSTPSNRIPPLRPARAESSPCGSSPRHRCGGPRQLDTPMADRRYWSIQDAETPKRAAE